MKTRMLALIALLLFPALVHGSESAKILSIDTVQVLKIAPQDKRAIIKTSDGKMRIIQAGEVLQSEDKAKSVPGLRVDDISTDRVVIIEIKAEQTATVVFSLSNGTQRVERR